MMFEEFKGVPVPMAYHLIHPKPAVIVVSMDRSGRTNGMTIARTTLLSHCPAGGMISWLRGPHFEKVQED